MSLFVSFFMLFSASCLSIVYSLFACLSLVYFMFFSVSCLFIVFSLFVCLSLVYFVFSLFRSSFVYSLFVIFSCLLSFPRCFLPSFCLVSFPLARDNAFLPATGWRSVTRRWVPRPRLTWRISSTLQQAAYVLSYASYPFNKSARWPGWWAPSLPVRSMLKFLSVLPSLLTQDSTSVFIPSSLSLVDSGPAFNLGYIFFLVTSTSFKRGVFKHLLGYIWPFFFL